MKFLVIFYFVLLACSPETTWANVNNYGDDVGIVFISKEVKQLVNKFSSSELIKILKSDDFYSVAAANVLGDRKDPRTIAPLISELKNSKKRIRSLAKLSLEGFGAPIVPSVVPLLWDGNSAVRNIAVDLLESLHWKPTNDQNGAYFWILKKEWAKVEAIGLPSVDSLFVELNTSNDADRDEIVKVLVNIGISSVEPIIKFLNEKKTNPSVRKILVKVLGKIKDPRAVEPLLLVLKKDEDADVRSEAVIALNGLKYPLLLDLIAAILKNEKDSSVRITAVRVLEELKDPRAIEPLILTLRYDDNKNVRGVALWALADFKDPRSIKHILAALNDIPQIAATVLVLQIWPLLLYLVTQWQLWLFFGIVVLILRRFSDKQLWDAIDLFEDRFFKHPFVFSFAILTIIWVTASFVMKLGNGDLSESFFHLIGYNIAAFIPFSACVILTYTSSIKLNIKTVSLLTLPLLFVLTTYLAISTESWSVFFLCIFLIIPLFIIQITFLDGLFGLFKSPWRRTRLFPQKHQWICQHDHHRPVFKKLSPWLTRWTNRHILVEKPPCADDFSDHWRCPVCDRTDWLSGVGTVVGVIGGSLGQPVQNGDVLSLPLIGADGRAVAADLDRIEVSSWPSGCHDVDVLNSVFIRFQYAARKPLKDVPIHLAPNVTLSDSARDLAVRHFGLVVAA